MTVCYLQIVAIPYAGQNKISLVVVIPKSKSSSSLTVMMKEIKVAPDLLKNAIKKMKLQTLFLTIPKFKIETKFDLNDQYRNVSQRKILYLTLI